MRREYPRRATTSRTSCSPVRISRVGRGEHKQSRQNIWTAHVWTAQTNRRNSQQRTQRPRLGRLVCRLCYPERSSAPLMHKRGAAPSPLRGLGGAALEACRDARTIDPKPRLTVPRPTSSVGLLSLPPLLRLSPSTLNTQGERLRGEPSARKRALPGRSCKAPGTPECRRTNLPYPPTTNPTPTFASSRGNEDPTSPWRVSTPDVLSPCYPTTPQTAHPFATRGLRLTSRKLRLA